MTSLEITIAGHKFTVRAHNSETDTETSESHLAEVAEMVRRKVEGIKKQDPSFNLQKAAMLAAFDFASEAIAGRKKALDYRSKVLAKTNELVSRIESELSATPNH
jgi:cell division protein ZapA (FtsZ GTPase activity inhibitor)